MSWIVLLAAVAIVVVFIIVTHNGIIAKYNRVKQAWSDVVAQERQKAQILPKIESLVQEHKEFEQDTLAQVTAMRSAYDNLAKNSAEVINVDDLKAAMATSHSLMSGLKVAVEAYPELQSNKLYASLMKEISEQEENVGAAIRIYNGNVAHFNTNIEIFPNNMVNNMVTKKAKATLFQNEAVESALGFSPTF